MKHEIGTWVQSKDFLKRHQLALVSFGVNNKVYFIADFFQPFHPLIVGVLRTIWQ
jgi:hypothetical protein